jgi:hypothetical protein
MILADTQAGQHPVQRLAGAKARLSAVIATVPLSRIITVRSLLEWTASSRGVSPE